MNITDYARQVNCADDVFAWIEKRVDHKIPSHEVEHIIDYLASDARPKRLDRATFEQMNANAQKWVNSLIKKGKDVDEEVGKDVEVTLDFGDGFSFVKLITPQAYSREGNLMAHCVASYADRGVTVYSLRDKDNMPHCTIEDNVQIKGKGNGSIHPRYVDYVVRFLEHKGMNVRASEMANLGYKAYIPSIVKNELYRDKYLHESTPPVFQDNVVPITRSQILEMGT